MLTVNAPIGFGFRDEPGDIVNRSFAQNDVGEFVGLEVASGKNITLLGGNINFEAGEITASGGNIELGGLSEAGIVGIKEDGSLSFSEEISKADVNLNNAADIDVRGRGGGNITINARNLNLLAGEFGNSLIRAGIVTASTSTDAQAGNIIINVAENIVIDRSSVRNLVTDEGIGNAGNIIINTNFLEAINGGQVNASTFGQGNAGAIDINATGDITLDGEDSNGFPSSVASQVNPGAVGDSGGVIISTTNLNLTNGGSIDASTLGGGNAGAIDITATGDITANGEGSNGFRSGVISGVATDVVGSAVGITISTTNLNLTNGGIVSADTFGQGNAGAIDITATGDITVDGEDSSGFSSGIGSLVNSGAVGDAGGVIISTTNLSLSNGGIVSASTFGQGNAGAIDITATGNITADGENLNGFPSGVTSGVNPGAVGDSGGVIISTTNLNLTNGGRVDANTFGQGNAGVIDLTATGNITADGEDLGGIPSGVTSGVSPSAIGDSGGVIISTSDLNLTNGGRVDASTFGEGNAGAIDITATGDITADRENSNGISSAVASQVNPGATGNAGGITISTTNLNLTNGGRVDATTGGEGNAGAIDIAATGDITADGEDSNGISSAVASQVVFDAVGNAGGVTISTTNLNLINGGSVNASTFGEGNAGNITIDANNINLINRGNIQTTTQSNVGISGIINLQVAEDITLRENSSISAVAKNGLNITGKGGIPPAPDLPLNSYNISINGEYTNSTSAIPQPIETSQGKIQPARGIKITESGKVILTAYRTNSSGTRLPENSINCSQV